MLAINLKNILFILFMLNHYDTQLKYNAIDLNN
jgi:hypothetical protein